jgi:outer membrane protein insertion porin family
MLKIAPFVLWLFGLLMPIPAASALQSADTIIERIDIRGNRRIPEETIRGFILSRQGEAYNKTGLGYDLRSVYKSNYFEYIEIQARDGDTGKIVTFVVQEKPLIRAIEYVGNKSFAESDILEAFKEKKIGLSVDSQYDPSKIRLAERTLKELMLQSGKPLGTIYSETESIPPASVRVRFVLDEGAKVRIGKILFIGNKVFSDKKLKGALELSKERNMITMFKGTDKYHEEKLAMDVEYNLKDFYKSHGYMKVQVGDPLVRIFEGPRGMIPFLRKTKQQFYIEVPVEAGDQYRIGKLELEGCGKFITCEMVRPFFGLESGDIVNFIQIKDTLEQIKKLYGNMGFINFAWTAEENFDDEAMTYDLYFTFMPDKQFFVRRINFLGNTRTRDKVMRREFTLEEGRIFSTALLDNSILRLNQLGFFEKIEEEDYEVKPDEKKGLVDIDVTVKEKSRRSIGFTGGVSGISGSFIGVNYSDNNFLGRGQSLEVSLTSGTRTTNFIVAFTEPYLFDTRWSMGLSLFNQRYRYDTYNTFGFTNIIGEPTELFTQKTMGATLTLNRRLGHSLWSVGGSYSYQNIGIGGIAEGFEPYALSQFAGVSPSGNVYDALSGIIRSEVTPILNYNSTNAYFLPTRGTRLTLSAAIAGGLLGGDFSMIRPAFELRHFFPDRWLSGGRNVFAFKFQGQYIQAYSESSVPFFDRFFIGGENTIRGFDIRSISPIAISSAPMYDARGNPIIDLKTGLPRISEPVPTPVGGDTVGIFNFEYRIPIVGPLSFAAFYDLGFARVTRKESLGSFGAATVEILDTTNNALRSSTGLEIQFVLPVVSAPFRLIFAWNPQRIDEAIKIGTKTYLLREPSSDIKFTVGRSF